MTLLECESTILIKSAFDQEQSLINVKPFQTKKRLYENHVVLAKDANNYL
jgi:hypothetical protein